VGWENDAAVDDETFIFGSFRLVPAQRVLLDDGKPVRLGGRALHILMTLVEHAGETISREQLIAHAWPDTVVDDLRQPPRQTAQRRATTCPHRSRVLSVATMSSPHWQRSSLGVVS